MRPRRSRSASEDRAWSGVARPRTARLPCRRASGGAPRLSGARRHAGRVRSRVASSPGACVCAHVAHWAAARGATRQSTSLRWRAGRSVVSCGLGFDGAGPAACSRPGAPLTVGGAAHAVLAPRDDAGGPHVRQTPTHPRVSEPRTGVDLSGGRGLGRHGEVARVPRQEAVVAEGPPNAVRRSISTGLRPPAPGSPGTPRPGASPAPPPAGLGRSCAARLGTWRGSARTGRAVDPHVWARGAPSGIGRESPPGTRACGRRVAPSAGHGWSPRPSRCGRRGAGSPRQCREGR